MFSDSYLVIGIVLVTICAVFSAVFAKNTRNKTTLLLRNVQLVVLIGIALVFVSFAAIGLEHKMYAGMLVALLIAAVLGVAAIFHFLRTSPASD